MLYLQSINRECDGCKRIHNIPVKYVGREWGCVNPSDAEKLQEWDFDGLGKRKLCTDCQNELVNRSLIALIIQKIQTKPARFDMERYVWHTTRESLMIKVIREDCGTIACIGGWAMLLHEPYADVALSHIVSRFESSRTALGLSRRVAHSVFNRMEWPDQLSNKAELCGEAKVAVEVLQNLIDHGPRYIYDWRSQP